MKAPLAVRAHSGSAFRAWLTPPPLPARVQVRDIERLADFEPCYFGGIPGHEIGEGPLIVAVHGWGGRPAQMAPLARMLADEGYRVLVPRLPGHAGGRPTDIKQAAEALRSLIADVGRPELVVAHSFASMVLRLAFDPEIPHDVVLVAPALDVDDSLQVFGDRLGLFPWVRRGLRRRLEGWDPSLWPTFSSLLPEQMPGARVLIVHDPEDDETSFARSAELAAIRPATTIVSLPGTGHNRILASSQTIDAATGFIERHTIEDHTAA